MHNRWWVGAGLAAVAVVLAACGSNGGSTDPATSSPAASAATQANAATSAVLIKTMSTSKGTVLTVDGRTLYWFAKDTSTQSNCNGSCATYWPPVIGTAIAASGTSLPHVFGTIKRADGQTQATYDGHPLYTYTGDTARRQVNGNGLNASGGLWWAVTPSGTELGSSPAPAASSSSSSSGGSGGSGW